MNFNIAAIIKAGSVVLSAITQIELLGQPVTFKVGNQSFTLTKNA